MASQEVTWRPHHVSYEGRMPFSTSLGTTYERPGEVSEPLVLGKPVTVVPGPFPEVIGTRFQALRLISLESGVAAYRDESSS